MAEWDADLHITPQLVAACLSEQFAPLAGAPVEPFGHGWDNAAFLVDERWVFRFPRRAAFAASLEVEAAWLPWLAPQLPLPISSPDWIGQPSDLYPHTFCGYRLITGQTLDHWLRSSPSGHRLTPFADGLPAAAPLDHWLRSSPSGHRLTPFADDLPAAAPLDNGRGGRRPSGSERSEELTDSAALDHWRGDLHGVAASLGRFLRALHDIALPAHAAASAPQDTLHRADMARRAPRLIERLDHIAPTLPAAQVDAVRALLHTLPAAAPHPGPSCWVHGDLYARHLVLDARGALAGVIDWGDLHQGDPALDLSAAWSLLPPAARPAFWAAYGPIDEDAARRARFRALHYGVLLTAYGDEVGDGAIAQAGRDALALACEDSAP